MTVEIQEGNIVRLDDDVETPWLVIHIEERDTSLQHTWNIPTSVWVRKMTRKGRVFTNPRPGEQEDVIVTMNRLWIA